MSKKIEFQYENQNYCLEYDRKSVKILEQQGFDYNEFIKKPMSMGDLVFQGAFLKNHRNIKIAKIDEIFKHMNDKDGLIMTLLEMIQDTYETLYSNDEEKNTEWKVV